MSKPKILLFDIETKPIKALVWQLWDVNIPLEAIVEESATIAWAAKWLDDPKSKIMYMDLRKSKDLMNDKTILKGIWKLLDEADIVITQNGKSFDQKVLNGRFAFHGLKPPSSYRHIDTKILCKRHFKLPSYKLEYLTKYFKTKHQKLKHNAFPGLSLWIECLKGNQKAWKEMERYNKHDVLSLEDLYKKVSPWGTGINFSTFTEDGKFICECGSNDYVRNGHDYRNYGKYARYICKKCGAETRDRRNLLHKDRRSLLRAVK